MLGLNDGIPLANADVLTDDADALSLQQIAVHKVKVIDQTNKLLVES